MFKNIYRYLSIALVVALLLTACAAPVAAPEVPPAAEAAELPSPPAQPEAEAVEPPAQQGFTLVDAKGRSVTFEQAPQRIVIAGRATALVAGAVFAFPQASERVVAFSSTNQGTGDFIPVIDPAFEQKTGFATDVGPEQVAAVQPDAVLMKSFMSERLGEPLEILGIPVVYVDLETPEQYERDLLTIGKLFQDEARAAELVAFFQQTRQEIADVTADLADDEKPSVLILYYTDRDGEVAFNVPPLSWIQTRLVEMAGGEPAWRDADLGNGWTKVSLEQVAVWDADQIYVVAYHTNIDEVVATLKADPKWQAMRAVQNGTLYAFPADYYSWDQPDTRWLLGLTWLATRVQPELFAQVDVEAQTRAFYRVLYYLDKDEFDQNVLPVLKGDHGFNN